MRLDTLLFFVTQVSAVSWQLTSVSSSSSSIALAVERGSATTNCQVSWTGTNPTNWTKCADTLLRFRIFAYTSPSNFSLEVVQVATDSSTSPATIDITRASVAITSTSSANVALTTTAITWKPTVLNMLDMQINDEGVKSGVIPCTSAWTLTIINPDVATLGPITAGRGAFGEQDTWRTNCGNAWTCSGTDSSIGVWNSCSAPAFQFKKTIPAGGNTLGDFITQITHQFPLLMASSIRGSNLPDYQYTDPEDVKGLDVLITTGPLEWSEKTNLYPVSSGSTNSGDCAAGYGCQLYGGAFNIPVTSVTII